MATLGGTVGVQAVSRFYPRHPRGWRHPYQPPHRQTVHVSIHATLAGGDSVFRVANVITQKFLSTPPSRVATRNGKLIHHSTYVSIHATLAGGDQLLLDRGLTREDVSIHATLAGGDSVLMTLEK